MSIKKRAIEDEVQIEKIWNFLLNIWIDYKNISPYILAFIHKSIVNERPYFAPEHNERLEFLWDAVLELVITENLFKSFPEKPEWELTDIRSAIVRWKNLAKVAETLKLNEYLLLGKWEEKWGWRENEYLLANTLEAFIWALYLDLNFEEVKKFVEKYIYTTLEGILKNKSIKDYKTLIQELSQARYNITPRYEVLKEEWLDHDKKFTIWIYFDEQMVWSWTGSSKKKAEENAAENAYLKFTN